MKYPATAVCALMLCLTAALGAAEPGAAVRIPFANHDGIRDWLADGERALYVQALNGSWYHAELMGPCTDLPFADRIGFQTEANGDFDKFSAIIVHHHACMLKSLAPSAPPPRKARSAPGATPDRQPGAAPDKQPQAASG